jgi:hypothetical protein
MLRPVAQHHYNTGKYKGNDKDPECSLEIYKAHAHAKKIKGYFTIAEAHVKLLSFFGEEIHECIAEAKKKKTGNISCKTP